MITRRDLVQPPAHGPALRDAELLWMIDAGCSLDEIVAALGCTLADVHESLVRLRRTIEHVARASSE